MVGERYMKFGKSIITKGIIIILLMIVLMALYSQILENKKVKTEEEPGKELKEWSYSVPELAEMLEVTDGVVYDLIKRNNIEVVIVDYWKRVPKAAFQKWYDGQSRYRTKDDKKRDAEMEAATLTMPEMARQLGITRNQVYGILNSQKYQHFFEFVTIADRKRITKESFQKFLEGQDEYHLDPANDYEELAMEENSHCIRILPARPRSGVSPCPGKY